MTNHYRILQQRIIWEITRKYIQLIGYPRLQSDSYFLLAFLYYPQLALFRELQIVFQNSLKQIKELEIKKNQQILFKKSSIWKRNVLCIRMNFFLCVSVSSTRKPHRYSLVFLCLFLPFQGVFLPKHSIAHFAQFLHNACLIFQPLPKLIQSLGFCMCHFLTYKLFMDYEYNIFI